MTGVALQDDSSSTEIQTKIQREVPESFKKLRGLVSFTEEEIAKDERLAYILWDDKKDFSWILSALNL